MSRRGPSPPFWKRPQRHGDDRKMARAPDANGSETPSGEQCPNKLRERQKGLQNVARN
jgi:hypothetical protein